MSCSTFVTKNASEYEPDNRKLILLLNEDGTVSLDQETLQKILTHNHDGVNVVQFKAKDADDLESNDEEEENQGQINLNLEGILPDDVVKNVETIASEIQKQPSEEPAEKPNVTVKSDLTADDGSSDVVINAFSQMNPEELAKLETVLQSEQAKEILGQENLLESAQKLTASSQLEHVLSSDIVNPVQKQSTVRLVQINPKQTTGSSVPQKLVMFSQQKKVTIIGKNQQKFQLVTMPTPNLSGNSGKVGNLVAKEIKTRTGTELGLIKTKARRTSGEPASEEQVQENLRAIKQELEKKKNLVTQVTSPSIARNSAIIVKKPCGQKFLLKDGRLIPTQQLLQSSGGVLSLKTPTAGSNFIQRKVIISKASLTTAQKSQISNTISANNPQKLLNPGQTVEVVNENPSSNAAEKPTSIVDEIKKKVEKITDNRLDVLKKGVSTVNSAKSSNPVSPKTKETGNTQKLATPVKPAFPNPITTPQSSSVVSKETANDLKTHVGIAEDLKRKKEKIKPTTPVSPLILGPELFSSPDIIKRVGSEKSKSIDEDISPMKIADKTDELLEQAGPSKNVDVKDDENIIQTLTEDLSDTKFLIDQLSRDTIQKSTVETRNINSELEKELEFLERGDKLTPEKEENTKTVIIQKTEPAIKPVQKQLNKVQQKQNFQKINLLKHEDSKTSGSKVGIVKHVIIKKENPDVKQILLKKENPDVKQILLKKENPDVKQLAIKKEIVDIKQIIIKKENSDGNSSSPEIKNPIVRLTNQSKTKILNMNFVTSKTQPAILPKRSTRKRIPTEKAVAANLHTVIGLPPAPIPGDSDFMDPDSMPTEILQEEIDSYDKEVIIDGTTEEENTVVDEEIKLDKTEETESNNDKDKIKETETVKEEMITKSAAKKQEKLPSLTKKGSRIQKNRFPNRAKNNQERQEKKKDKTKSVDADYELEDNTDETDDSDGDEWKSEDDPDRLWCICQRPHNNRFMICCDKCQDWFHGNCVGITKAMGQQIETEGIEWSCPKCKEKLKEKSIRRNSTIVSSDQPTIVSLECLVCRKSARVGTNFCSDHCIKKHVSEMMTMIKKETDSLQQTMQVSVYDRSSKKLITGKNAPQIEGLIEWLASHQSYEILRPSDVVKHTSTLIMPKPKTAIEKSTLQSNLKQTLLIAKTLPGGSKQIVYTNNTSGRNMNTAASGRVIQLIDPQPHPVATTSAKLVGVTSSEIRTKKLIQMSLSQQSSGVHSNSSEHSRKRKESLSAHSETKKKTEIEFITSLKPATPSVPLKKPRLSIGSGSSTSSQLISSGIINNKENQQDVATIRSEFKKKLITVLDKRATSDSSLPVNTSEIEQLGTDIEEEIFKYFGNTGAKYKTKFRSLYFNIGDDKNFTLYKKILEKIITPAQVARLSPEEMASQELAQWREKEQKHQIEIIKKTELELIHQAKTVVLKSRKGEEIIENKPLDKQISELELALNRTADDEDYVLSRKSDTMQTEEEINKLKEKLKENRHKSSRKDKDHKKDKRDRDKDKNKDREKDKDREKERVREHSRRKRSRRSRSKDKDHKRSRSRSRSRRRKRSKSKEKDRKKKEVSKDYVRNDDKEMIIDKLKETKSVEHIQYQSSIDETEPVFMEHSTPPPLSVTPPLPNTPPSDVQGAADSDVEPTSTVISTPPYEDKPTCVWDGALQMPEVAKISSGAFHVSGNVDDLFDELPETLNCVGRIAFEVVWDYISKSKKTGNKDIVVLQFKPDERDRTKYTSLFNYLSAKKRMSVIGNSFKTVKDFYVYPLSMHSPIPQVLLPLDGPGFEDKRSNILLAIIIRSKRQYGRTNMSSATMNRTVNKTERSYTPPLTTELPSSSKSILKKATSPTDDEDSPYSPEDEEDGDSPYEPPDESNNQVNNIIKVQTEKIAILEQKKQEIESSITSLTSVENVESIGIDDDDEDDVKTKKIITRDNSTYSPTSKKDLSSDYQIPFLDSSTVANVSIPSNIHEILANIQHKTSEPEITPITSTITTVLKPKTDPVIADEDLRMLIPQTYVPLIDSTIKDDSVQKIDENTSTSYHPAAVHSMSVPPPVTSTMLSNRLPSPINMQQQSRHSSGWRRGGGMSFPPPNQRSPPPAQSSSKPFYSSRQQGKRYHQYHSNKPRRW